MRVASLLPLVALLVAPADARRCKSRSDRYPPSPTATPKPQGDSLFQQPGQDNATHGDGGGHNNGNDNGHQDHGDQNQPSSDSSTSTSTTTTPIPSPTDNQQGDQPQGDEHKDDHQKDDQKQGDELKDDQQGTQLQGDQQKGDEHKDEQKDEHKDDQPTSTSTDPSASSTSTDPSASSTSTDPSASSTSSGQPQPSDSAQKNPTEGLSQDDQDAVDILDIHNGVRTSYGLNSVWWNVDLSSQALNGAQMCEDKAMNISQSNRDLTDVYWLGDSVDGLKNAVRQSADNGGKRYDYSHPGIPEDEAAKPDTPLWMQMVWKGTDQIGCNWHKCDTFTDKHGNNVNNRFKLSCVYNMHETYYDSPKSFEDNIPPKKDGQ